MAADSRNAMPKLNELFDALAVYFGNLHADI
jgi:hypothetical protein